MELVGIIQSGGPFVLAAVMAFLYWTERTERKEWQRSTTEIQNQFIERTINAINGASQATRDVTAAMQTLHTTFQSVMFRLRDRGANDPQ